MTTLVWLHAGGLFLFGLGLTITVGQIPSLLGVKAGAEYFDLDVTLIRVVWLLAVIFGGCGLLAYFLAWIVMPNENDVLPVPYPTGAAPSDRTT